MQGIYSEERAKYLVVTDPYEITGAKFYYLKSQHPAGIQWNTYHDLAKYELGQTRGYYDGKNWEDAVKKKIIHVNKFKKPLLTFRAILKRRIDLAGFPDPIANKIITEQGWQGKFDSSKKPALVVLSRFSLGLKSKHLHLLPQINQLIGELQAEGIIDEILEGK